MMKFNKITAVSIIALMASTAAFAETLQVKENNNRTTTSKTIAAQDKDSTVLDNVKSGLISADNTIRTTAENIKVFFIGKDTNSKLEPVLIQHNTTANGLINKDVINDKGLKITTVKDIIIDKNGRAILIVVTDGGFLGIGEKVAAFNYSKIVEKKDGIIRIYLSKSMIDKAAEFSYDQKDFDKTPIIPKGSVSINNLLKGNVLDNNGYKVADIENVYIRDSDVSQIIVSFNKTFGMGGVLTALNYNDLQMIKKDDNPDFKLTYNQTEQFKQFKKSVNN